MILFFSIHFNINIEQFVLWHMYTDKVNAGEMMTDYVHYWVNYNSVHIVQWIQSIYILHENQLWSSVFNLVVRTFSDIDKLSLSHSLIVYTAYPLQGHWRPGADPRGSGTRWGTPWTWSQSIAGLTRMHICPHTKGNSDTPITLICMS